MYSIAVAGAGKIGSLMACLLGESGDYKVYLLDSKNIPKSLDKIPNISKIKLDVTKQQELIDFLKKNKIQAIASSLPFFLNVAVAQAAKSCAINYFDLTEDVEVTKEISHLAEDSTAAFVPQCGLAPGFISIAANSIMQEFDECLYAKLRVGAIPQFTSNALHYALSWSTDGIINEYGNLSYGIKDGQEAVFMALEGLEIIQIEDWKFEAFHTSGGLGSLAKTYLGKVKSMDYKTIRYPGHCKKMRFLMNDLRLNDDRKTLKHILERAIPKTFDDIVIIYINIQGMKDNEFIEKNYIKKIYPREIANLRWSAIQVSTAASICAIIDIVLQQKLKGLILQEHFKLSAFLDNQFGKYYL